MRRLLELHQRIRNNDYPNCSTFSKEWEVSAKTVQRDIDFLRDQMGAPIEYDKLKNGYYYTNPSFMLPSIMMNEGELLALAIGVRALEGYRGSPIAEKLEAVLEKLSELLPNSVTMNPKELFSQFTFSAPPALPVLPDVWENVLNGLITKRQLEIDYNGKKSRVHPLHLANLQGQWYLFVRFYDYDNFKQLSMGRIRSAACLKESVNSSGFNVKEFLQHTLGRFAGDNEATKVILEFPADVAESVIEREWHKNQEIKILKDGRVHLTFMAKGEVELKRWVLAWGRYCKVISPKWAKEMIDEEVDAMIANRV